MSHREQALCPQRTNAKILRGARGIPPPNNRFWKKYYRLVGLQAHPPWEIWEPGNLEIWGPENPEIWRSGDLEIQKFGVQKIEKIKILKIQIRSAQNVGKVWISRKKSSRPHLGPSHAIFSMDRKNQKNAKILPIFLGGCPIFLGVWHKDVCTSLKGNAVLY